jgi:hypothetical protein
MLVADITTTTDAAIQQLAGTPQCHGQSWQRRLQARSHHSHRKSPRPTYANSAQLMRAVVICVSRLNNDSITSVEI